MEDPFCLWHYVLICTELQDGTEKWCPLNILVLYNNTKVLSSPDSLHTKTHWTPAFVNMRCSFMHRESAILYINLEAFSRLGICLVSQMTWNSFWCINWHSLLCRSTVLYRTGGGEQNHPQKKKRQSDYLRKLYKQQKNEEKQKARERERYIQLNRVPRIARKDNKAFLMNSA